MTAKDLADAVFGNDLVLQGEDAVVLMTPSGNFYLLMRSLEGDSVFLWGSHDPVTAGAAESILGVAEPLPRDGSVFGWVHEGRITSLIVFYVRVDEYHDEPIIWSVMYRPGEKNLPPFASRELFTGSGFWDHYAYGRVASLSRCLGDTRSRVWWLSTYDEIGSDCCAVAEDLDCGVAVLPAGVYAGQERFLKGPVPSLEEALKFPGKLDVGPLFPGKG